MDNDLMARRLRPPSQPPRPQNGHLPMPTETPPWAALPEPAPRSEVPWDRPDPEPWPPVSDDDPQPEVWPPTEDSAEAVADAVVDAPSDYTDSPADTAETAETAETSTDISEPAQDTFESPAAESGTTTDDSPWDTGATAWDTGNTTWDAAPTDAWAGTSPWEAQAETENGYSNGRVTDSADAVAEPMAKWVAETSESPEVADTAEWVAESPETADVAEPTAEWVAETTDAVAEPAAEWGAESPETTDAVAEPAAEWVADSPETTDIADNAEPTAEWVAASPETTDAVAEPTAESVAETSESPETTDAVAEPAAEWAAESPETTDAAAEPAAEWAAESPETASTADTAQVADTDDAPEAVESMVQETSDEPTSAYGEWSAEEVTEQAETVEVQAVAAEPNDAPWETAAEAEATAYEAEEPTMAVADEPEMAAAHEPTMAVADAQPETVTEPEPEAETAPEAVAEASDADGPDGPDSFAASWDAPEAFDWAAEEDAQDDRPTDMFASYDNVFPVVSAAVVTETTYVAPAATAEDAASNEATADETTTKEAVAQDPDDSMAPVLNDVDQAGAPNWTIWQAPMDVIEDRGPNQPAFAGKIVGPTPPDDLFGTPTVAANATDPRTAEQTFTVDSGDLSTRFGISAEVEQAVARQLPALYSTAPASPAQPLVVRIELTIVDETNKVRSAEMARRVGPWEADAEQPTVRHPEFEPRIQMTDGVSDEVQAQPQAPATEAVAASAVQPTVVSPAPVEPAAETVTTPTPEPAAEPVPEVWERAKVFDPWAPVFEDVPAPQPAAQVLGPQVDVPWAEWNLEPTHDDPLSSLPAATFAPVAPQPDASTQQAAHSVATPAQAFDSEAPVSASQTAAVAAATTRPSGSGDQSDLWFLASEPDGFVADQAAPEKAQPSTMLTAGLTVTMAVVVIILVFVFIQLMTSLLK